MLKTRNRIINFRVTEDEFTRLRAASVEHGARCLSDFARTAILIGLDGWERHGAAEAHGGKDQLQSLARRLGTAERNIAKLEGLLSRLGAVEEQDEHMTVGASV